jgi:hypothetical protein
MTTCAARTATLGTKRMGVCLGISVGVALRDSPGQQLEPLVGSVVMGAFAVEVDDAAADGVLVHEF